MNEPLSLAQGNALAEAFKKLHELNQKSIVSPNDESEKTGLKNFISRELFDHASEFIACWIAVRTEYEPLVAGFSGLLRRAGARATKEESKTDEKSS